MLKTHKKPTKKVCLIFIGPPGCGKGTQSATVALKFKLPRLEMGEHFRRIKSETVDPEVVIKLKPLEHGGLVDDNFTIWQAKVWIMKHRNCPVILIDGAIRTKAQLDSLQPFIKERGYKIKVIWFSTALKACFDRLKSKPRPGRTDDVNKSILLRRFVAYARETRHLRPKILEKGVETLTIDNTFMNIHEVEPLVIDFFLKQHVA